RAGSDGKSRLRRPYRPVQQGQSPGVALCRIDGHFQGREVFALNLLSLVCTLSPSGSFPVRADWLFTGKPYAGLSLFLVNGNVAMMVARAMLPIGGDADGVT